MAAYRFSQDRPLRMLTQGGRMPKKRGKSISFDAMVKFFLQSYGIPTKRDIEKLITRLDRLEELIKATAVSGRHRSNLRNPAPRTGTSGSVPAKTASDKVLELIKASTEGIGFANIHHQVGYDEKKLRNIIFRLNKTNKIRRIRRGLYKARG